MIATIQTRLFNTDYQAEYLRLYYSRSNDDPERIGAYIAFLKNCIDDPDFVKARLRAYGVSA